MKKNMSLTDEQRAKLQQLEFCYQEAKDIPSSSSENDLFLQIIAFDKDLRRKSMIFSFSIGFLGILSLVTGLNLLFLHSDALLSVIPVFCIGILMLASAYPFYNYLLNKSRKKYAPVVLTITNYLD